MNKTIEGFINPAMTVLQAHAPEGRLPTEMKGYISSLGASILMSGLVPTIAFYATKENASVADRGKILQWVFSVLHTACGYPEKNSLKDIFDYARQLDKPAAKKLERDILNISVALKLCIRTFELT